MPEKPETPSQQEGLFRTDGPGLISAASQLEVACAFLEQLRGGSAVRAPYEAMRPMVDALGRGVPFPSYSPTTLGAFRGRIGSAEPAFATVSDFTYRPKSPGNGWGRCHRRGDTVFYGSLKLETMLPEVGPEHGDYVHYGFARLKPDVSVNLSVVGEIDYIRRYDRGLVGNHTTVEWMRNLLSQMDTHERARTLLVDAFFADAFQTPAQRPVDYKLTAAISEFLLDGENRIDGFFYPSVAHRGGLNVAIRPGRFDDLFDWVNFSVCEIKSSLGFGLFGTQTIWVSDGVSDDGRIAWKKAE